MSELAEKLAGKFIVIDGPDGAGKSTQLKLLGEYLVNNGAGVVGVIDPGTTNIGNKIRALLLDRNNGEIGPMCETLLFMASRAQLVLECVKPSIEKGKVVLCDRFVSATIAYQGASGVDTAKIVDIWNIAGEGFWPDLTIILDIPPEEGMDRIGVERKRLKNAKEPSPGQLHLFGDRMEHRSSAYHKKVREALRKIDKNYPAPVKYVDGHGEKEEVFNNVIEVLKTVFA